MAGPKDRKHSHGKDKSTRESRVSLASYYRGRFPPPVQADIYEAILMRMIPKVERVEEGEYCHDNCDCGLKVTAIAPTLESQKPTIDHQFLALARIKERAYGQPAQHTHIEAEIRAEVTAIAGGVDPRYLGKLSPKALMAIKYAMENVDPPALPEGEPDSEIIDTTSEEVED